MAVYLSNNIFLEKRIVNVHCCEQMDLLLEDPKVPIEYYPIAREYGLTLRGSSAVQLLYYCPWCGTKLPESVRDLFFQILREQYNIDPGFDIKNDPNIPPEFKSDEWWKKRSL